MPSRNKSRRGRSERRGRSGGANDMNHNGIEMSNTERANAATAAAPPMNVNVHANQLEGIMVPPAPQFNQPAAQQNVNMAPVAPQGQLGLAFIPLQGAHHYPQVQQHAGRKSRRHTTRRHKSHRRKSHRR